jgi:hypothetical protein
VNLKDLRGRVCALSMAAALNDRRLLGGLVLALALRLVLLPLFSDPLNFYGFNLTASFALDGQNPWVSIARDPAEAHLNPWGYPPLFLLPTLAASAFSLGNGFVFGLLIRVPLILATLATGVFLYRTARELGQGESTARVVALSYVFCPLTLLVDTVWGANDPLAVACVAGALYFLVRKAQRPDLAALLLGLGIAFKLYPILLVPLGLSALPTAKARLRFLALAALPGAISAGPALLLSPVEFLRTIGVFAVGNTDEGATMGVTWLLRETLGVNHGGLGTALFVAFALAVAALGWAVHRRRLSLLHASTVVMLGLFLAAPRVNPDYFLWALPFIALSAGSGVWTRLQRYAATLSWTPVLALALIYNGASGVTGLFYWALVAGAPRGHPYRDVPDGTQQALVFCFLLLVALAAAGLLGAVRRKSPFEPPKLRERLPARLAAVASARAGAVLAVALVICLVLAAAVASARVPVLPEDFGSYHTRDHRVTVVDDFKGGLFGFTYSFSGTGYFELNTSDSGWLEVDTGVVGGNAFLTRLLPNQTVEVSIRARVEALYPVPGVIEIARIPSGWVGVQVSFATGNAAHDLVYHDDVASTLQDFGPITLGRPLDISLTLAAGGTAVRYGGLTAYGSGAPPSEIALGHPDVLPEGGGRVGFDQLELSWQADPSAEAPGLLPALLGTGVFVLALPVWWWRRQDSWSPPRLRSAKP